MTSKARYKAIGNMTHMYGQILRKMRVRIRDIELNREALITGVKVFDVKGSDLELILDPDLKQ